MKTRKYHQGDYGCSECVHSGTWITPRVLGARRIAACFAIARKTDKMAEVRRIENTRFTDALCPDRKSWKGLCPGKEEERESEART